MRRSNDAGGRRFQVTKGYWSRVRRGGIRREREAQRLGRAALRKDALLGRFGGSAGGGGGRGGGAGFQGLEQFIEGDADVGVGVDAAGGRGLVGQLVMDGEERRARLAHAGVGFLLGGRRGLAGVGL